MGGWGGKGGQFVDGLFLPCGACSIKIIIIGLQAWSLLGGIFGLIGCTSFILGRRPSPPGKEKWWLEGCFGAACLHVCCNAYENDFDSLHCSNFPSGSLC